MISEEILKERNRIKSLFSELLDELIEKRQSLKRYRSRHTISISEAKDLEWLFFQYIDDPSYIRKNEI